MGFVATWVLGITALLGTLAVTIGRTIRDSAPPLADGAQTSLIAPPGSYERPRWAGAHRIDTLPGVLSIRAAVDVDSAWVLLDSRARQLVVLPDTPKAPILRFGREGDGPGEFRDPWFMAVSGNQIGVLEARGDRLVRFDLSGQILGAALLTDPSCVFGPGQALLGDPRGGFVLLRTCSGMRGSTRGVVQRVDLLGRTETILDLPLQSGQHFDPFRLPVITHLDDVLLFGLLSEGCLRPLDSSATNTTTSGFCAPAGERLPLPDSIRARLEALATQASRVGQRLEMPEALPPFIEVRTSSAGPLLRVPLSTGGEALDLLHTGGKRTRIDAAQPDAVFVGRDEILLVEDLMVGTRLGHVHRGG